MAGLVRRSSHVAQPETELLAGKQKEEDEEMEVALSDQEDEIAKLRQRWELASVFNFLTVFEPVTGKIGKASAEEIKMGLVTPNDSLAQIHIALSTGIPPASKALDGSDAWVTVLCKKLVTRWPWVAEGKILVVVAKGEEISRYKGLEPTERLFMLKALCELRADQDDAVAYINDAVKEGTEISSFRKEKIGGDAKRISYWYDGNTIIGHRLYKEVIVIESRKNVNGKGGLSLPNISFQWETVATNLEEFQKVAESVMQLRVLKLVLFLLLRNFRRRRKEN